MKKFLKRVLKKLGLYNFARRVFGKDKKIATDSVTEKAVAKGVAKKKMTKPPFSQLVYGPRWRLKNYYALSEFGPAVARWYIEQRHTYFTGEFPDLDDPKTFNEKIHWLSLNYHDPLVTTCCDRYALKDYVTERVGVEYVIPLIKTYKKPNDINLDALPKSFALKVNWGDGAEYSFVIPNKDVVNINKLKNKISNALAPWNNLYYSHMFWGYKDIEPVVMVEAYIGSAVKTIVDYKLYCFDGKVQVILVGEKNKKKKTYLDTDWNILPCYVQKTHINYALKKPDNLDEMIRVAEKLAKPFPFVRVDLYSVQQKVLKATTGDSSGSKLYVGEMTFNPSYGFERLTPYDWNVILGDLITLPEKKV